MNKNETVFTCMCYSLLSRGKMGIGVIIDFVIKSHTIIETYTEIDIFPKRLAL